jgi:hypothetical protein
MKRYPFFCLLIAIIICSCHFKHTEDADEAMDASRSASKLIGAYNEPALDSEVALYVFNLKKDSIHADFKKNESVWVTISVPLVKTDTGYVAVIHDSNYNKLPLGVLNVTFDINDSNKVTASWEPSTEDTDKVWAAQTYILQRRLFTYAIDKGDYPQASLRLLVDSDVNKNSKESLQFMRNEIYARHGYCFEGEYWQSNFETTDWYVPYSADISKDLTDIEKKNITLIKKYEKTAKDDDFGRE